MSASGEFEESGAIERVQSLPLAHLSLEVGHLYLEDLQAGPQRLEALFTGIAPWAEAVQRSVAARVRRPRISTCFLIDDYFSTADSPERVVPQILAAAQQAGIELHYLVREAACAQAVGPTGPVSPAELLIAGLVEEPEPATVGWRPSAVTSGWLSNGRRSPVVPPRQAAMVVQPWEPPLQNAVRRHSIFVDVQLWDEQDGRRVWSCPFLAATWQFLRLGLLRNLGAAVLEPQPRPEHWPASWSQLPAITRLMPRAPAFAAYSTTSVLSSRFLPVEVAVRTVLAQIAVDPQAAGQVARRAAGEGITLPVDPLDRIEYVFAGVPAIDPPG